MTAIRSKGKNASNTYNIPDEHSFSEDIILEQLKIIDELFPSTKISDPPVAEKRNYSNDDRSNSSAKRKKIENSIKTGDDSQSSSKNVSSASTGGSTSTSDKVGIVNQTISQPVSRIELKESIKRAFQASTNNSDPSLNDATTKIPPKATSSSSKVTRDIHEYISVVNPKGQMQKKLEQAAPYNFFLTTITDCKETHQEPLSITFQGK